MKRFLPLLAVLLLSCDDERVRECPVCPVDTVYVEAPDTTEGIQRVFDLRDISNFYTCQGLVNGTQTGADMFCVSMGYEYATSFHSTPHCISSSGGHPGPWLVIVTCWKR